jgi:hypothetical protein
VAKNNNIAVNMLQAIAYKCYATNSVGTGGSTQVVIGVTGSKYFFLIAQLYIS